MGFLATLRGRLTDAVMHRPLVCADPVLGELEQIGGGLWQTRQPVLLLEGMEPIGVTIETEILGDLSAGSEGRTVFLEFQKQYPALRSPIGKLLANVSPRVIPENLADHALLESLEIWREPRTGKPVLALEYVLTDSPEYTYIVRVENGRPVDVVISG